jgi:hypothetical protein
MALLEKEKAELAKSKAKQREELMKRLQDAKNSNAEQDHSQLSSTALEERLRAKAQLRVRLAAERQSSQP